MALSINDASAPFAATYGDGLLTDRRSEFVQRTGFILPRMDRQILCDVLRSSDAFVGVVDVTAAPSSRCMGYAMHSTSTVHPRGILNSYNDL